MSRNQTKDDNNNNSNTSFLQEKIRVIRAQLAEYTTEIVVSSLANEKDMSRRAHATASCLRAWIEKELADGANKFVVHVTMSEYARPGFATAYLCSRRPSTDFDVDFVLVNEDVCCVVTIFFFYESTSTNANNNNNLSTLV